MTTCSQASVVVAWAKRGAGAELDSALERHLETCDTCHELFRELALTRSIAKNLPVRELDEESRDAMRFALMAEARRRGERRRYSWPVAVDAVRFRHRLPWVLAAAALLVFGLAGWFVARPDGGSVESAANVVLLPGAQGVVDRGPPDEIYRLSKGTADFSVNKVGKEQRYRVLAGDGTVEVRGTRFRLEVTDGRLQGVEVTEGRVWVWLESRLVADLEKGDRWTRPHVAAAEAAPARAPALAPASAGSVVPRETFAQRESARHDAAPVIPRSAATPPASPLAPSSTGSGALAPDDTAFARAWDLLRRGDSLRAAAEFDALMASGSLDASRRADVLYWAAQAYSRAGRPATAEARARRLVGDLGGSFRAADAALMLGDITLARGERAEARRWFQRAASSSHPSVRARAEKSLSALGSEN